MNTTISEGCRNVATRIIQAGDNFIETIQGLGEMSEADARAVFEAYKRTKLIKLDAVNARYQAKHGALLDYATLHSALRHEKGEFSAILPADDLPFANGIA